jgi:uncharacterized membrane protein
VKMKPKGILALFVILALALGSGLSLAGKSAHGLTSLVWLFIIFPIFGYSLSTLVLKKKTNVSEVIGYSAGLLLLALFALGLLLNSAGLISHRATLVAKFVVPCFDVVFCLILGWTARRKTGLFSVRTESKKIRLLPRTLIPVVLPVISVLGAIQLNNGGSSFFAIASLCAIIIYELLFFFSKSEKSELDYVINLFCVSLALVLSFSMRSNHIIGFDINQEFQVFSAVLRNGVWHPHLLNSTYNACLSITVLPAVVKSFVQLSPEFVFKFAMQIILCITPIVVFSIANKLLRSPKLAFLAALFFIVQNQFIIEFPSLIRQQSAMLLFGLMFVAASSTALTQRAKQALFLLFGVGVVISHYSTAYVSLTFLLIVVLIRPVLNRLLYRKNSAEHDGLISWSISPLVTVALLLFAFCWYGQLLESTGNVVQNITKSVTSFNSFFAADSRSSFVTNNLGIGSTANTTPNFTSFEKTRQIQDSFPLSIYGGTKLELTSPNGPDLSSAPKHFTYKVIYNIVPALVKLVAVLGSVVLLYEALKKKRSAEEGLFVISAGLIFAALVILPFISQDYNLERLYQQLLIVLSAAFIVGSVFIVKKLPRMMAPGLTLLAILIYFTSTSGLASQGLLHFSDVNLINDGNNYDKFYVKDGEYNSLIWLGNNYKSGGINIDRYATLRTDAYTRLPSQRLINGLLPSEITMTGYVYATDANLNKNLVFDYYQKQVITYSFPSQLLNNHKDTVYVNSDSKIYK